MIETLLSSIGILAIIILGGALVLLVVYILSKVGAIAVFEVKKFYDAKEDINNGDVEKNKHRSE